MKVSQYAKFLMLAGMGVALLGCGNLSNVSSNGTTDEPVWPEIDKAKFQYNGRQVGTWPNWNNVRQIEKGMNKAQLYDMIGRPHFSEGFFNVREWDYVFNFREHGEHKICQYKVLFDSDMNVAQQWWLPNGCHGLVPYELNTDTLFDFDKSVLTQQGQQAIKALADEFIRLDVKRIHVQGHTDRIGRVDYNLALSERRAETVKQALISSGVKATIVTEGVGKSQQVKACSGMSGKAERDCLRPNRRVVINADGGYVQLENTGRAGHDGPTGVRTFQQNEQKTSW